MRHVFGSLALLAGLAAPAPPPTIPPTAAPRAAGTQSEQRLHYTPRDRETGRYQYVPIHVPAGTTRLTVAYAYDRAEGANVVDLGLFEPGSLDLGTHAFRGWSGGARTEVTIQRSAATPGYWPGEIPAGEWHVALGLYKVAPTGVDVTVTATTSNEPDAAPTPTLATRPTGPLRKGPAWYSGALHLHTVHSDGRHTVAEVCRRAREAGLDFVAITDHNNTTHQLDAVDEPDLLRIVGEELTTPGGHASVWGLGGWRDDLDFRVSPGDGRIADLVRAAAARSALFAIDHPKAGCPDCGWAHDIPDGVTAIEVNGVTAAERAAAIALWDSLLRQGRRLVAVGSSDWHSPDHAIATASVRVWASELSERAILDGIRAGHVVVMAEGRLPPPILIARTHGNTARIGDTILVERGAALALEVAIPVALGPARVELVWNGEVVETAVAAAAMPLRYEREIQSDGYVRAHVSLPDGTPVAVTNPIFVKASSSP